MVGVVAIEGEVGSNTRLRGITLPRVINKAFQAGFMVAEGISYETIFLDGLLLKKLIRSSRCNQKNL